MKKSLLFAALVMGAMSANAQSEYCAVNAESAGIGSDAATVAAGTVIGTSDNVTMKIAYEDACKSTQISFQNYDRVVVNGTEYEIGNGVTGSTNPTGQSLAADASTPVTAGFVVDFDTKADGYLTVIGKMSSNKEYYVWEGDATAASPVAYRFAMDWSAAGLAANPTLAYQIPADKDGYVDFSAADIATYLNGTKFYWPEQIVLGAESAVKKNGVGVICFPVYADMSYLVQAAGSKISTCGAVFTKDPVTSVVLKSSTGESADVTLIGGVSGINSAVAAKANVNAPMYNLAGQRVNNSFKGIAIQNGKKFINK